MKDGTPQPYLWCCRCEWKITKPTRLKCGQEPQGPGGAPVARSIRVSEKTQRPLCRHRRLLGRELFYGSRIEYRSRLQLTNLAMAEGTRALSTFVWIIYTPITSKLLVVQLRHRHVSIFDNMMTEKWALYFLVLSVMLTTLRCVHGWKARRASGSKLEDSLRTDSLPLL
jgi:hypothetical protein